MSTKSKIADKSDRESHAKKFFADEAKSLLTQVEYLNLRNGDNHNPLRRSEAVEQFILEGASDYISLKVEHGYSWEHAFNSVTYEWPAPAREKLAMYEMLSHNGDSQMEEYVDYMEEIVDE